LSTPAITDKYENETHGTKEASHIPSKYRKLTGEIVQIISTLNEGIDIGIKMTCEAFLYVLLEECC